VPRGARIVSAMPRFVSRSCHSGAARRQPRASSRSCAIVRAGLAVANARVHAARRSHRRLDDVSTAAPMAADRHRGRRCLLRSRRGVAPVRRRVPLPLARHTPPPALDVVHAAMNVSVDSSPMRLVRSVPVRTVEDRIVSAIALLVIAGVGAGVAFGVGVMLTALMCGGT
jgi:hypothetical protein